VWSRIPSQIGSLLSPASADGPPLELGKGQEHIEREPPHAGADVEGLRDRHKRDVVGIEQLDEIDEISKRAGQAGSGSRLQLIE
jgi:hypothetical protein